MDIYIYIFKDIGRFSQVPHNGMPVYHITHLRIESIHEIKPRGVL